MNSNQIADGPVRRNRECPHTAHVRSLCARNDTDGLREMGDHLISCRDCGTVFNEYMKTWKPDRGGLGRFFKEVAKDVVVGAVGTFMYENGPKRRGTNNTLWDRFWEM